MPISDMIKSHDICIQQTDMEFDAFVLHECIYDVPSNIPDLPYFLPYKMQFFPLEMALKIIVLLIHWLSYTSTSN